MRVRMPAAVAAAAALTIAFAPAAARAQQAGQADSARPLPATHWAYRSLAALQERGVAAAATKAPATRAEIASVVARTLDRALTPPAAGAPVVTVNLYSNAQLRRLLQEFEAELAASGVDVDAARASLDVRTGTAPGEVVRRFSDVPQNHWAFDAVESSRVLGILRGYPDGTF